MLAAEVLHVSITRPISRWKLHVVQYNRSIRCTRDINAPENDHGEMGFSLTDLWGDIDQCASVMNMPLH